MPNLCNTALNILRIIGIDVNLLKLIYFLLGKYLRMAKILKSTAEQVFDAILQLFYYFVYSVVYFLFLIV